MKQTKAIIDLGSNSIRMNILGINEKGGYSLIEQASEMVRLSEGMGENQMLGEIPMERTINALIYFKKLLDVYQVVDVYPLATAAVRMAKNQADFLKRVEYATGLDFIVLSGDQEAYYDYLGVVNTMALTDAVILDIGGGSTEIIWMSKRLFKKGISLPIGSVTLTEKVSHHKSRKKRIEQATLEIEKLYSDVPWLSELKGLPIIGLGGILRTLGKIDRNINAFPIENMHNYKLDPNEVEHLFNLIHSTEDKDLDKIDGISKRRADIITMGILPFKCLLEKLASPEVRISGNGLRDGYFLEKHLLSKGQASVVPDVLTHSQENFINRFEINKSHAAHVQFLALKLFDAFKNTDYFQINDRKLLMTAAMLHDIGMHIEYYDHHIHGFYLVLNGRLDGLSNTERLTVAYLVGSHREENIKGKMKDFETIISKSEIQRLGKLVCILNLAEQLDRAENGVVKDINALVFGDTFSIELISNEPCDLERAAAGKFIDRFEKNFGLKLIL